MDREGKHQKDMHLSLTGGAVSKGHPYSNYTAESVHSSIKLAKNVSWMCI